MTPETALVASGVLAAIGVVSAFYSWKNCSNKKTSATTPEIPCDHDELNAIFFATVEAIVLIDNRGIMRKFNPAAEKMFGYSQDEVIGKNVSMLMPSPHKDAHDSYIAIFKERRMPKVIGTTRELAAIRKNGESFPIDLSVSEKLSDSRQFFVGVIRDITDRKEREIELVKLATTDSLTQACNRRYFIELFRQSFEHAKACSKPISLVWFDMDKFQSVNETYGHAMGDRIISEFVVMCRKRMPENANIGRMEGKGFALFLPGISRDKALILANQIHSDLSDKKFMVGTVAVHVKCSCGVTTLKAEDIDWDELFMRVHRSIWYSKENGGHKVIFE